MPERKGVPTVFDPSYKGVGQKVGLEIWRVEKLKVVKKPPTDDCYQGKLYSGDSYIILQTKMRGNAMERHIFFWLGAESSQDEMGVAAYKTVELDESLGGEPVQHREVQGHETDEFLKLFKNGVRYMEGGVATGFKHVDPDAFPTELLHIKGARNIRALKVPVKVESLNHGDSFILDKGRNIFVWSGKEASRSEKVTAIQVANSIRDNDRSGKAKVVMCEKADEDKFFTEAGFDKKRVRDASAAGADEAHSRAVNDQLQLVRVSDASGSMEVTEINEKPYKQDQLDTNDVFIVYVGPGQPLYVWVGKGASKQERAFAVQSGVDYLQKKGLPMHTPVTRIRESFETAQFKNFFGAWKEPVRDASGGGRSKFKKLQFSTATLHEKREAQKATLPDDGQGKLEVWRIEDFEMAEWPKDKYGHFYGGDSYVMLYTYMKNSKEEYIIYFWQGLKSSQDEKGASAIHAVALDDKYGGAPVQVRVVQNKEPPHFLLVMKKYGGLVVHEGGRASGFKNVEDTDKYDLDGTRFFHVRGTNDWNTRAVQVPEEVSSLNSGDVFVLDCPTAVYLWFGKASTGDEREYAKTMGPRVKTGKGEIVTVFEGDEPKEFWAALGWNSDSRPEYSTVKVDEEDTYREPRLFQCSNARGYFYVEEVFDFDQEDLIEDDVMLLDTYYELFVWVGKNANVEEKKKSLDTALEFVKTDPSGRTVDDVCIMQIKQGNEPSNFTCHFLAWDNDKWAKLAAAGDDASPVSLADARAEYSTDKKYTIEQLVNNDIPESVDRTKKEEYLTDEDFEKALKMNRAEFEKLPGWKKNNAKKAAKLF